MLELALTTRCCSDMVRLLLSKRGWTMARIARVIGKSTDYLRRVQTEKQSFQLSDVEALARACGQEPHMLIFNSMRRGGLSAQMQGLYDLTQREIDRHDEFKRALNRKGTKRRRARTKAA